MEDRQTETASPRARESQAITAVGSATVAQEPVRVDVSVMVSAKPGEGRPTLAVSELPEEADTVDQSGTGKKNIHKRVMFEGMLRLPVTTNKKPSTGADVHTMDIPRPNRLLTRQSLFDVLVQGSYGVHPEHPEGLDKTTRIAHEVPVEDQDQRALMLRETTDITVFDEDKTEPQAIPSQESAESFMVSFNPFSPSVVEALLAESTHKKTRFGKRSMEDSVGILPNTPIVPDSEQADSEALDLSVIKLFGGEKGVVVPDDVPWLLPLEEKPDVGVLYVSPVEVSAQEELTPMDPPVAAEERPACTQAVVDASVATKQKQPQERPSPHVAQPSLDDAGPSVVRSAQEREKSVRQTLVPHHEEHLVRATMGECRLTESLPDDLNPSRVGCEVPVQSLGLGIAYALGDAVSLVVKSGKNVTKKVVGTRNKKPKPRKIPVSHASSELTVRMGGRVFHGVRGVFSGGRMVLHGGKDVVLGTAGCLVGMAESLTNTLLPSPKPLSQP